LIIILRLKRKKGVDEVQKENTLKDCIRKAKKKKKKKTCKFDENQLLNNHKMIDKLGWKMNKINSTKSI